MVKTIRNILCKIGLHTWEYEVYSHYSKKRGDIHRFCTNCRKVQDRVGFDEENEGFWKDDYNHPKKLKRERVGK